MALTNHGSHVSQVRISCQPHLFSSRAGLQRAGANSTGPMLFQHRISLYYLCNFLKGLVVKPSYSQPYFPSFLRELRSHNNSAHPLCACFTRIGAASSQSSAEALLLIKRPQESSSYRERTHSLSPQGIFQCISYSL